MFSPPTRAADLAAHVVFLEIIPISFLIAILCDSIKEVLLSRTMEEQYHECI
jgi:hypothetical protein